MGTSRLRDSVYSEISSDPESGTRNNFEYGGAHIPTDDEALDSRSISPVQDLDPAPLVTDTSNSSSDSDSSPLGHSLPTVPCSISISTDSVLPHDNAASTESQANYTTPESICSHTKRSMKGCTAVQYMIEWWLWELCGIGLSISTVVAVVALAINLDGTLLNDWKHGLSPNAVISALITVAKTAMLFALAEGLSQTKWLHFWERQEPLGDISVYDDASRGPWGSLKFLRVSSRCKPSMIACVGAIITLLVQAMGPVAQQIVVFDTQSVQQFGVNSSLLVTKTYNVSYLIYDVLSESLDSINSQRAFQHALLDGLIKANVPLGFTCQSGNCSWPNFSTLGMCRNYTDVSSMTNVNIVKPALGSPRVNFTTSSGFQFLYDLSPIIGLVEGEVKLISDINANFVELQFEDSSIKPDDASFIRLIMVQQGSRSSPIFNGTITATDINATITECIINWCARTYQNFSVFNGILSDYSVHEQPLERLWVPTRVGEIASYIPTPEDTWQHGTTSIYPFADSIFTTPARLLYAFFTHLVARPLLQTSGADASVSGLAFRYGNNVSDRMNIVADSLTNWIQTSQGSVEVPGTNSV